VVGLDHVVSRQRKALFNVPDHFRFQLVAMGIQQRLHAGREGKRTLHLEALMRFRQIRMRLLDDHAGVLKAARGSLDDLCHLRVNRGNAEIAGEGNLPRLPAGARLIEVRGFGTRLRDGIAWFFSAHGVEQ
jgi:hypothetical protein